MGAPSVVPRARLYAVQLVSPSGLILRHGLRLDREPRSGGLQAASGVAVMPTTLAYLVAVLVVAVALVEVKTRAAYSCPACGTKRADGHSPECPWGGRP